MTITEHDLEQAGYQLELWNNGAVRSWIKESSPTCAVFLRVEQEWHDGPFIPALMVGRIGGSVLKLAGLDSLAELDALYDLILKGMAVTPRALFEQCKKGRTK